MSVHLVIISLVFIHNWNRTKKKNSLACLFAVSYSIWHVVDQEDAGRYGRGCMHDDRNAWHNGGWGGGVSPPRTHTPTNQPASQPACQPTNPPNHHTIIKLQWQPTAQQDDYVPGPCHCVAGPAVPFSSICHFLLLLLLLESLEKMRFWANQPTVPFFFVWETLVQDERRCKGLLMYHSSSSSSS